MWTWRSILVTGGSSGLGAALALELAAPGVALALTGQDGARLAAVAAQCEAKGANVRAAIVDVRDRAAMAALVAEIEREAPLDLVLANAGISGGTGGGSETPEQTRRIFDVNVAGVFNTVEPALAAMAARKRGQITIVSSLASFRGMPGAPAYCASKAAVRVWGEALRADWDATGIRVNVVCPGFVVTRMTARNPFHMPLLMPADRAARIVLQGLKRNRGRIAFPLRMYAAAWLLAALPGFVLEPLLRRLPRKN
jgi:NAD(P)-dependent dehydrogenase (short-subunit alcohol dehydrogenase family)